MVRLTAHEVRSESRNQPKYTHTYSFCMNVAPPKIHVVNLMSSVIILEGGALGRYLRHEVGALKNGD